MKKALLIFVFCLLCASGLFAKKHESPALQQIEAQKALGQPYGGDLWHQAEAEYQNHLARREASRSLPMGGLDDGGATWQQATTIGANPYQDNGTTVGKGNDAFITSCLTGGDDTAEDAWYVVHFNTNVYFDVWCTCASNGPASYDTRLGIFDDMQMLVACNDDAENCGAPNYQSAIIREQLVAGTYYIAVDGYDGESGPYQINASWVVDSVGPCVGSDETNAQVISTLPFVHQHSTVGTCDDVQIGCEHFGDNNAPDYWYRISLNREVLLDVWTTCGAQYFDSKLAIFDQTMTQIYCNDDAPTCATFQSHIENAPVPAGWYYIVVDGYQSSAGNYELHVDTTHYDPTGIVEFRPDITIRADDLYDNVIVTNVIPDHRHLRFSNGTPNAGIGKLYLYGVFPPTNDSIQAINQRVYRSDGSFYDRQAGNFIFHPQHDHIHVQDWCIYRLRTVVGDSGVGAVLVEGEKTSFCIEDIAVYDPSIRNFNPDGQFHSCASTIQGMSVGWVDIYDRSLFGQWLDITNIAEGVYWLEAEADPDNHILESDETNNVNRVMITLGNGPGPDPYEPNNSPQIVDGRVVGGSNSPNLGPCNPERTVTGVSIHVSDDPDYYRFYMCHAGAAGDFARINFQNSSGDLDMVLFNSSLVEVRRSEGVVDSERVALSNLPEGWYYLFVYGYNGATNLYTVTINPPANTPPTVTVVNPPAGNVQLIHGQDQYTCTWTHADAENDLRWVTVYVNTEAALNGNEILLPTSLNTNAETGFHIISSAYFPVGTYYVYCSITDGGTTTGDWSAGTVTWNMNMAVDPERTEIPYVFSLDQNYPNPFNPSTTIRFGIAKGGAVTLRVYDILGREAATVVEENLAPGNYRYVFDGRDLASGVYLYTLSTPEGVKHNKMILLK